MSALLELAARCEAATEATLGLFHDAFDACFEKPGRGNIWTGAAGASEWTPEYAAFIERQNRFTDFLEAGAFLDAALTLVPEGCAPWHCGRHNKTGRHPRTMQSVDGGADAYLTVGTNEPIYAMAATPALALCAAALRARSEAAAVGGR